MRLYVWRGREENNLNRHMKVEGGAGNDHYYYFLLYYACMPTSLHL